MRRNWLVIALVVIVAIWVLTWLAATVMTQTYSTDAERAWPFGLGTLADAKKRYPPAPASPGAYALISATAKLGIDIAPRDERRNENLDTKSNRQLRDAIRDYVITQMEKAAPQIDALPPGVGDYLAAHAADLAAVRSVIFGEQTVAWTVDYPSRTAPLPNLLGHVLLMRVLLANALDRAQHGDPGAWEDAHAVAMLSQNLWSRPEFISSLVALSMSRSMNAVARKLPLPAPAWFDDFAKFDYLKAMMASRQAEAAVIADAVAAEATTDDSDSEFFHRVTGMVVAPYVRLCEADALDADRRTAMTVASNHSCTISAAALAKQRRSSIAWWNKPGRTVAMPNVDTAWPRVYRFRLEIEASQRALRLRAGQPPLPDSSCGGRWIYDPNGFHFSENVPSDTPTTIPLAFALH